MILINFPAFGRAKLVLQLPLGCVSLALCRNWLSHTHSCLPAPPRSSHPAPSCATATALCCPCSWQVNWAFSQTISTVLILRNRKQAPAWCGLILIQTQVSLCHMGKLVCLDENAQYEEMHMSMGILCVCSFQFCRACLNTSPLTFYCISEGQMQKKKKLQFNAHEHNRN